MASEVNRLYLQKMLQRFPNTRTMIAHGDVAAGVRTVVLSSIAFAGQAGIAATSPFQQPRCRV